MALESSYNANGSSTAFTINPRTPTSSNGSVSMAGLETYKSNRMPALRGFTGSIVPITRSMAASWSRINSNPYGTPIMDIRNDLKYVINAQKIKSDLYKMLDTNLGGGAITARTADGELGEINTRHEQRSGCRRAN
mmetsp:Transcript_10062/g.22515  ORF Transcript_10062/g.22515 Transcript_10062/m.22515 type:complete len:136 (-) Transcript_10062:708-1115(-)|eukprot:CAMPEP_0178642346 /NCGR_PEP_ID=MMETSP0698-20121128/17107_1 /TAXON_ID=265572 /ORGANISM="Extubocellulus spinifer, Strain CCMP396" /LENGTH=135 /DNA_ID=CAMNT_0020283059 /DNA_START=662 /DNA_END=1069 /DNA_ORIENTATION=+